MGISFGKYFALLQRKFIQKLVGLPIINKMFAICMCVFVVVFSEIPRCWHMCCESCWRQSRIRTWIIFPNVSIMFWSHNCNLCLIMASIYSIFDYSNYATSSFSSLKTINGCHLCAVLIDNRLGNCVSLPNILASDYGISMLSIK